MSIIIQRSGTARNDIAIGGKKIIVMAGPCAVESEKQIMALAKLMKDSGVSILRGGAFKPRTSPSSFQGLGEIGLKLLRSAADKYGLRIVTEVMDTRNVALVNKYSDIIQIGTRNMHNTPLLREVGLLRKPVLLKRGMGSTLTEFMSALGYVLDGGNKQIILCERGTRTFENETRNALNISAIPFLKQSVEFPVIVDPSHATGKRSLVIPVSKAAIAAGADGLLVEVHPQPEKALCDGTQSLTPAMFSQLMKELKPLCKALGRTI